MFKYDFFYFFEFSNLSPFEPLNPPLNSNPRLQLKPHNNKYTENVE
jgi:hypothetical protein